MRMKHRDVLGLVKKVNNFSLDFTNRYRNWLTKRAQRHNIWSDHLTFCPGRKVIVFALIIMK
jgi:hypothetical protein